MKKTRTPPVPYEKARKRHARWESMIAAGHSVSAIAAKFGVTRQGVHQAMQRMAVRRARGES